MAKKTGLGRGLGAFGLGNVNKTTESVVTKKNTVKSAKNDVPEKKQKTIEPQEISIDSIKVNPHQPRHEFDEESMKVLADSVRQYGVLQPVLVRKTVKGYELIAGERRYRASKMAGMKNIPAVIREYNDAQMTEVALIENIQRENLNPIEEANAYQYLLSDYGLTQEMLSKKVGRSRPHIANFLRLLNLSEAVKKYLADGTISMGQAKPLLALEEPELQDRAAAFIIENDLSVRKVEILVKKLKNDPHCLDEQEMTPTVQDTDPSQIYLIEAEDKLKMALGTSVRIKGKGKKQKLEIDFASLDELQRIIDLLTKSDKDDKADKIARLRAFSTTGKFTV